MNPPTDDLRANVFERAMDIRNRTDEEADAGLAALIAEINEQLVEEIRKHPPFSVSADALAAACDAWASLASHALAQVHAPMSPFPRNRAGWGQGAIQQVQQFARILRAPLSTAQQGLGASSYSISVGFPWGVSIGFTWP